MSLNKSVTSFHFLALLVGGISIGFAGIFMRFSDVNPVASAFWRMALAAPLLWGWALLTRGQDKAAGKRLDFHKGLFLAGFYFASDMALWHLALHYTTVANATLLANFAPIFIALWLWLIYKQKFSSLFVIGMAVSLMGAVMLTVSNMSAIGHSSKFQGDMLGLAGAIFYAAYQLVLKDTRQYYSTIRLMAWSTTVTAAVLLPLALITQGPFFPQTIAGWLPLWALAIVAQIGGQTIIAYALAYLPSTLSSVSLLIQPLTAAIAAWIIFNETLSPIQTLGASILLMGIYMSKRGSR